MTRSRIWIAGALLAASFAAGDAAAQKDPFDPGLVVYVELWNLQSTDLDLDVGIETTDADGIVGGELLDIRMENKWRPRFAVGWNFGETGTLTATVWAFDQGQDEDRPGDNDDFLSIGETLAHPVGAGANGNGFADSVLSTANVDVEVIDLEWAHTFVSGDRFRALWRVGARDMKFEEDVRVVYSTATPTMVTDSGGLGPFGLMEPISDLVTQAVETTGAGVKLGFEGVYQIGEPFAIRGRFDIAGLAGETDSFYSSTNQTIGELEEVIVDPVSGETDFFWNPGDPVTYEIADAGENKFLIQIEAEVGVAWNVTRGWDVFAGYRYVNWQEAITEHRFTDDINAAAVVTRRKDFNYGGFYLGMDYRF